MVNKKLKVINLIERPDPPLLAHLSFTELIISIWSPFLIRYYLAA
jgi:hypothetical protein